MIDEEKPNEGIIVIIHSFAKGNFAHLRYMRYFFDTLKIYTTVKNKVLDETKPPIVIELNLLDDNQQHIVDKIKDYVSKGKLEDRIKISVKDTDMPTFIDMAKSFGKALYLTGQEAVQGKDFLASQEEQTHRIDVCTNCDFFNHVSYTCNKCACNMQYKSMLKSSTCPMDKWEKFD